MGGRRRPDRRRDCDRALVYAIGAARPVAPRRARSPRSSRRSTRTSSGTTCTQPRDPRPARSRRRRLSARSSAADRRSVSCGAARSASASGSPMLGNSRLVFSRSSSRVSRGRAERLRTLGAGARRRRRRALSVTPWVVRNKVEVGCFTLTTDARALWKANNDSAPTTLLARRQVDRRRAGPAGPPFPKPEEAGDIYTAERQEDHVDECAQMRYYQHKVWRVLARPSGREGEARRAGGAHALGPAHDRPRRRSSRARRATRSVGAAAVHDPAVRCSRCSGSSWSRGGSRRSSSRCSRTTRSRRWSSPARRATASPWDFLLALLGRGARSLLGAGDRREPQHEGRPRPPDRRHRRLRAPPADAAAGARASAASTPRFLGLDDPARAPTRSTARSTRAVRSRSCAARHRPGPGAARPRETRTRRPRAHAPRPRGRLRRARRPRTPLVSTKHNDDRSGGPVPLRRARARARARRG